MYEPPKKVKAIITRFINLVALMFYLFQSLISLKYITQDNLDSNIKQTLSAAVTTKATLSLLKFCNPEIICIVQNHINMKLQLAIELKFNQIYGLYEECACAHTFSRCLLYNRKKKTSNEL